nr:hypothetical protein [Polaribacter sp.]
MIQPKTDDILLSVPDYMPTLLGVMGMENKIPKVVEGKNYADLFFDKPVNRPKKQLYFGVQKPILNRIPEGLERKTTHLPW